MGSLFLADIYWAGSLTPEIIMILSTHKFAFTHKTTSTLQHYTITCNQWNNF